MRKQLSSNVVFGEFILSNVIALPLMKPLFYAWRVAQGKVDTLEGFSWLLVGFDFSVNRSPLKTIVSRKVILFSDIDRP